MSYITVFSQFRAVPSMHWGFSGGTVVKNLPGRSWVRSLGWEDPMEGNGTHSNILAQKIPWTRGAWVGYGPWGCKESDRTKHAPHEKQIPSQKMYTFCQSH